tara:strand:- start:43 stop:579 length:537 start_codon:yes stop_codon:yes gene_type:complete
LIEPLTDEQVKKRAIGVEDVDQKGLVQRHRVLSQTLFDMLFLKEFIGQGQHEAAHLFMDSIAKSGASIRSANLDTEVFTPHRDVGNIIGERRMAFSSAYRRMIDEVGIDDANYTLKHFADVYNYPLIDEEQAKVARKIRPSLNALGRHYGTIDVHDARRLIRRFVGGGDPINNEGGGT